MKKIIEIGLVAIMIMTSSCKSEWLDIKSDKKLIVPSSLKDLQAVMDNTGILVSGVPSMTELSADNYTLTSEAFHSLRNNWERNVYIWASDIYEDSSLQGVHADWNLSYEKVYYANLVLEGTEKLKDLTSFEEVWAKELRGQALFIRSLAYYHLSQLFSPQYIEETASVLLGVPLRLSSDINEKSKQVTVQELYDQMIGDLRLSIDMLPETTDLRIRPLKAASCALLAKVFLSMGDYGSALHYADQCLRYNNSILDFNELDPREVYPIPQHNEEVIYRAIQTSSDIFRNSYQVSDELYNLYEEGDLRKSVFFKENNDIMRFHGSYEGGTALFGGLSVNEILLIRAECYARLGDEQNALLDLKYLLKNRYLPEVFDAKVFEGEVLEMILLERRKELPFRGTRWSDLRRLNLEERYQVTLTRDIDGVTYELAPNDPKYTLPFPGFVVDLNDFAQNER